MGERVDAVAAVFQALLARRCSDKGWSRVRVLLRVLRVPVPVPVLPVARAARVCARRTGGPALDAGTGAGSGSGSASGSGSGAGVRGRVAGLSRMLPFAETIVIMCSRVFIRLRSDEAPQAPRRKGLKALVASHAAAIPARRVQPVPALCLCLCLCLTSRPDHHTTTTFTTTFTTRCSEDTSTQ
jgi:hypothetical protein